MDLDLDPATIEGKVRRAMADHARMHSEAMRGSYDAVRQRHKIQTRIDSWLDELAFLDDRHQPKIPQPRP